MIASDLAGTAVLRRRLRVIALGIGVALLLWLPFEDPGVNAALAFSAVISGWWAVRFLVLAPAGRRKMILRHVSFGAFAGMMVSPLALLLMAMKTGLHGHSSPDFTVDQLQSVLASTPAWILSGVLLGFGSGLWRLHREAADAHSE